MRSRSKNDQNSATAIRRTRLTEIQTILDPHYHLSTLAVGAASTFFSRQLIDSDLDILGIPSIVNSFSLGVTTCAFLIVVSHQMNKMASSTKLRMPAQESLPMPTVNCELANPKAQASAQRKPISIPLIAKARRGYGKKHVEAHSWHSFSELKSWISFSKLKETWKSMQTQPKKKLSETALNNTETDIDSSDDEKNDTLQPNHNTKKKHHKKPAEKPFQPNNKHNQTKAANPPAPSLSTTNIYSCLGPQTQLLPGQRSSSSTMTSPTPALPALDEMITPPITQPRENESTPNEPTPSDAPCLNHATTQACQPLDNSEELKSQLALMRTQIASLSEQLLASKTEKSQQSEQLKEVSRLFQLISPESKSDNNSTLNLNQMKQIIEQLHKLQITMSRVKETSTNPTSYIYGAYTQRSYLAESCKNLLMILEEANPAPVTSLRPGMTSMR